MGRLAACVAAVLAAVVLGACGDDPGSASSQDVAGGPAGGDAAVTAKEFAKLAIPDELRLVERLVAANPEACKQVDPRSEAFRQAVVINAAQARPGTLISDLVAQVCKAS